MTKTTYIIIISLLFFQQLIFAQSNEHCYTEQHFQENLQKNSKLAEKKQALQVGIQEFIAKNKNIAAKQASLMTIPVVFHIVYNSTN